MTITPFNSLLSVIVIVVILNVPTRYIEDEVKLKLKAYCTLNYSFCRDFIYMQNISHLTRNRKISKRRIT